MPVAELRLGLPGGWPGDPVVDKGFNDEPSALINLQRTTASRPYRQRPVS